MSIVRDRNIREVQLHCDGENCGVHITIEIAWNETLMQRMEEKGWAWTTMRSTGPADHYCPAHGPRRPEPGGGLFSFYGEREEGGGLFS